MSSTPLLSISIPTYNRAQRLMSAVRDVLQQTEQLGLAQDQLEIVVTSNGSTDATDELMQALAAENPKVRYFRNDRNYGIDENIARAVENARGRFVHLLSDDDIVLPGTYSRLLRTLQARPDTDFLFLNAAPLRDEKLRTLAPPVVVLEGDADWACLDKDRFFEAVGVWMTFVSSFVVRREAWLAVKDHRRHVGTEIYLTHVALEVIARQGSACVSVPVSIAVRPHFSGSYRIFRAFAQQWRILILQHARKLGFNPATLRRIFLRSIKHDLPGRVMLSRQTRGLSFSEYRVIFSNTWDYPQSWVTLYPRMLAPLPLLKAAAVMKSALRRMKHRPAP
jgi:glycosyltransferase involved in cell wall biosynthesis